MATLHAFLAVVLTGTKDRDWPFSCDVKPLTNRVLYFCSITRGPEEEVRITKHYFRWRERVSLPAFWLTLSSACQPSRDLPCPSSFLPAARPPFESLAVRVFSMATRSKRREAKVQLGNVVCQSFFFKKKCICVCARACVYVLTVALGTLTVCVRARARAATEASLIRLCLACVRFRIAANDRRTQGGKSRHVVLWCC